MKILLCTDKMSIGGAETHIKMLAEELLRSGNAVTLVSSGGVFAEILREAGCKCIIAPLDKRDVRSLLRSAAILKRELRRCDIAHAHTRFTATLITALRGRRRQPGIVSTAHLPFFLSPISRKTLWGDRVLAVSSDIAEYLKEEYKLPKERISLTKNGIGESFFDCLRTPTRVIAHISRLDSDRSLTAEVLIDIAPEIFKKFPDFSIVIIGDGDCYQTLKEKAEAANEALGCERIFMKGASPDVLPTLALAEIFIGVSRAALEAMAVGVPTIISGNDGYGGIINECSEQMLLGTNLCARGEVPLSRGKLLSDITELLSDEVKRASAAEYSKAFAKKHFSARESLLDAKEAYLEAKIPPRVCLVGYFGYGNLGDESTLDIATHALFERGITDIKVLAKVGGTNDCRGRFSPTGVIRTIIESDIIIFCGGNLLQEETSRRSLSYYETIIRISYRLGRQIFMLSSGFGGFISDGGKRAFSRAISLCDYIGARTEADLKLARKFNTGGGKITLMPDLCFLYKGGRYEKRCADSFAVILSRGDTVAKRVSEIAAFHKLRPIFIGLFESEDGRAVKAAAEKLGSKSYFPKTPEELFKLLSHCKFTVTRRLHGGIFSVISRTPAYLSVTPPKNRAFFDEIKGRADTLGLTCPLLPLKEVFFSQPPEISKGDFDTLLKGLRDEINESLDELFGEEI